jgi:hypothetical protein
MLRFGGIGIPGGARERIRADLRALALARHGRREFLAQHRQALDFQAFFHQFEVKNSAVTAT